jgi:uncharacterized protein YndB with AHSA1/START domain
MQSNAPAEEALSLEIRCTCPHPPEKVFLALTDPARMMIWFAPPGCAMLAVDAEPKPGGRYTIRLRKPGIEAYCVTGVYSEVEPHRLLRFTWRWADLPGYEEETVVTIRLSAAEGWTGGLGNLGELLDREEVRA